MSRIFLTSLLILVFINTEFLVSSSPILSDSSLKCGISPYPSNDRIIGGVDAKPHQFPWIVYLQSLYRPINASDNTGLLAMCDGTLIDTQWILTAAHCFSPHPGYKLEKAALALGAHNLSNENENMLVLRPKKIYLHGDYQDDYVASPYDIALIQLFSPLTPAELTAYHLAPICLPDPPKQGGTASQNYRDCCAIGWGVNSTDKEAPTPAVLKVVQQQLLSPQECKNYHDAMSELQVCAGYEGHGVCQGDSGGPFLCRDVRTGAYQLVGITSYGNFRCGSPRPSVYTAVDHFLDWINQTMALGATN